jgi:hypothetical protein
MTDHNRTYFNHAARHIKSLCPDLGRIVVWHTRREGDTKRQTAYFASLFNIRPDEVQCGNDWQDLHEVRPDGYDTCMVVTSIGSIQVWSSLWHFEVPHFGRSIGVIIDLSKERDPVFISGDTLARTAATMY